MNDILEVHDIDYIYGKDTAHPCRALDHVSMNFGRGEFVGIIGHSGSGKSTLLRNLNGLLTPDCGSILWNGRDIGKGKKLDGDLRKHVGLVFQYPEHQLFRNTVLRDVMFGPENLGMSKAEAESAAKDAIAMVGLDETFYEKSPLDLSGGEMRKAAIAGVLAMKPEVLILDEPTVGLDPHARGELLQIFVNLKDRGAAVILVSHNMDEIAEYCNRVYAMEQGKVILAGTPEEVFKDTERMRNLHLGVPQITGISEALGQALKCGEITVDYDTLYRAAEQYLQEHTAPGV